MLECRLKQANNIGLFSALYADTTYIYNPFEGYGSRGEWDFSKKEYLFDDLTIIFDLKPLFNNGLIQFCKGELLLCKDCRKRLVKEFLNENVELQKSIFDNSKFIVEKKADIGIYLHVISNDDVFGHNNYIFIGKTKILENLLGRNSSSHRLTRNEMTKTLVLKEIIEERIIDMILQNRNADYYNCNYINSSNFSKNIINLINYPELNNQNDIIYNKMVQSLPVVLNADYESLIQFRKNEYEAFLVYRDTLQALIKQKSGGVNAYWDEIFRDTVKPEINKMNFALKNSKSIFKRKGIGEIAIGAGLLSFGLFSGLLPNDSTELIKILGGCEFIKGVIENLSSARSTPLDIKNNKFYFIWKLQTKI
jgi:hypothetical protein